MRISKWILLTGLALSSPLVQAGHGNGAQVKIDQVAVGKGPEAVPFSSVEVHYTGRLEDGTVFDSSVGRGQPFSFTLGAGQVIPGWEFGIRGMKKGGKRVLTIPPGLAYGERGAGNVIPPNATLEFEVELMSVAPPPFESIDNAELQAKLAQGVKLIDIRRPEEWRETGVVEGSIQSTAFDARGNFIPSFIDVLKRTVEPDEEFALICRTGNRTAILTNYLVTRGGYSNVLNVRDGITDWIDEGRPVSKEGG
ncbi:MAG: FKBP-type peptidyl-prolyl cis-trans isomerase [Gammaproteobacteria bacterium]|jgi:rhodanese-related sulfurtransferase